MVTARANTAIETDRDPSIPVMRTKFVKGWPEHVDDSGEHAVTYEPLSMAMTHAYGTDAHFAAYSVPSVGRRLATPLVFAELEHGTPIVLFILDVEPDGHAKVTPEWWNAEREKLERMLADHPGGFVYRTRGGYRVVYVLASPIVLHSTRDAEQWKRRYGAWLEVVRTAYGIVADPACNDWTRLYRLPHVVRDRERQTPETIGDPSAIGVWDVEVAIPEPEPAKPRGPSVHASSADAFDIFAFMASNYPGAKSTSTATAARRWFIECPWEHEHSTKSSSSTVVFAYASGAWEFVCLHSHCKDVRNHDDFRKWHDPSYVPFAERVKPSARTVPETEPTPAEAADFYAPIEDDFARGEKGAISHSQANILLALKKLGVVVRHDEFQREDVIEGLAGFGPYLDDAGLRRLRMRIDSTWGFRLAKELFHDVIADQANYNRFHPVRDYLASLTWDGTKRIEQFLTSYAGAPDTPYVRNISRIMLVAACRRVRQPGCKFDEMPILESQQGKDKSTALQLMAVRPDWFTDNLTLGCTTKEFMEQTAGKWIIEAGELKGMSKGEVADLKSTLSRQVDEARAAYGHKPAKVRRAFIVIGTTNETEGYLKDSTGNRRFWPVRVESFDLDKLLEDRDQLWAEAAHLETKGASIRLDPSLWGAAAVEQGEREQDDPMQIKLATELRDIKGKLHTLDAWAILGIEPAKATQEQANRLGTAMRKLGWERARRHINGDLVWAYTRGSRGETETPIVVSVSGAGPNARVDVRRGKP